jgi:hypothetical protein
MNLVIYATEIMGGKYLLMTGTALLSVLRIWTSQVSNNGTAQQGSKPRKNVPKSYWNS